MFLYVSNDIEDSYRRMRNDSLAKFFFSDLIYEFKFQLFYNTGFSLIFFLLWFVVFKLYRLSWKLALRSIVIIIILASHFCADTEKSHFTRDPSQLKGILVRASLKKSTMGFGFTIIGGDRPDEFLQVKNVLKDGPAAQDGKIAPGNRFFRNT